MYKKINKPLQLFVCNFFFLFFVSLFSFSNYFQKNVFLSVYFETEEEVNDAVSYIENSKDLSLNFKVFDPEENLSFLSERFNTKFSEKLVDDISWSINLYPGKSEDLSKFKKKMRLLMPPDNLVGLENIDFYNQISKNFKNLSFLFLGFFFLFAIVFLSERIENLVFVFVTGSFLVFLFSALSLKSLNFIFSNDIRSILQELWIYVFVLNIFLFIISRRKFLKVS